MTAATLIIFLLLLPFYLVNSVFLAEVLAGLRRPSAPSRAEAAPGRAVILIPAHNEAAVIGATLDGLAPALGKEQSILVVADNCVDDTAAIARSKAVEVIERTDAERRGKGFALGFARDWLSQQPPQAVVVLDADCRTDRDSVQALVGRCLAMGRPAQAMNLLEPAPAAGAMVQVSSFAFLIKNVFRQRGLQRLSGGVHLTGTGMALPWPQFLHADLETASIVEDIRLGIELGRRGAKPMLVEEATVWSPHAAHEATLTQRKRWEGGYLALARRTAPQLIGEGLRRGSLSMLIAGLDLTVPPLALLGTLDLLALAISVGLAALGWTAGWPPLLLALLCVLSAAAVLLCWWREGRPFLSPAALTRLPLYLLWKLPLYLGLLRRGAPSEWVRTDRPGQKGS